VQENSAGLPFPSAPLQSGLTSQLDIVNSIDSVSLYLIAAFGSGLDYSRLSAYSTLKSLYNFAGASNFRSNCPDLILSGQTAKDVTDSGSASAAYSGLGTVTAVNGANSVTVSTGEGSQAINLDNCTIKLANLPNYNFSVGDVLVWKGPYNAGSNSWNASQVTCFH
jgi:hypothetical protein